MPKKWKNLDSKQIFGNKIFGFREDKVQSPKTNQIHPVWVMDAPNWINIIPITPERKVILIKQYRFGNQKISLEIPGGMIDKGEKPKEAAIRELKEETGFTSKEVIKKTSNQNLDGMEDIEVLEVDLNDIPKLIQKGKIDHALVVSAFYFLEKYKDRII